MLRCCIWSSDTFWPFSKVPVFASCSNRQASLGGSAANRVEHDLQAAQGLACPIQADLAKEPMLNRIPFRTPGGIMTHGHAQSVAIAELLLQVEFKAARAYSITASGIGQDQEPFGARKALSPLLFLPAGQRGHGKLRRIGGAARVDRATLAAHVINPVGHGAHQGIVRKVMQHSPPRLPDPRLARRFCALPISSFFLVSRLLIGQPAAAKTCFWLWIVSN
jgi:hypothetical protein